MTMFFALIPSIFSTSESSAVFIFLITLDRFLAIKFPYGQVRFSKRALVVACLSAWLIGLVIALFPLLPPFQHWVIYSSNGMCLGLPLTTDRAPGWLYSSGVFIIFNFILFVFIAVGQFLIYRAMSKRDIPQNEATAHLHQQRRAQDFEVATQLSLIAISDFLCWFPIGFMGLMTLNGQDIGSDVYAWSAVLVLPINSALNPVLYTVPAVKRKWRELKKKHSKGNSTNSATGASRSTGTRAASNNYVNGSTTVTVADAMVILKDTLAIKHAMLERDISRTERQRFKPVLSTLRDELSAIEDKL